MTATTTPACRCANCPDAGCRCGCQPAGPAAPTPASTAPACGCGPACRCAATPGGCRCG